MPNPQNPTPESKSRVEEIYYNQIDPEIMDFQIHVRKVTGGNDYAMVDSTKLSRAIRKALTTLTQEAEARGARKQAKKDQEEMNSWMENRFPVILKEAIDEALNPTNNNKNYD